MKIQTRPVMIFIQIQKIMNDTNAEIKVAISKIARALEGLSLGVAVKTLTAVLVTFILHSTDPKKVADSIIRKLKRVAENAERGVRNDNN